ncbi:MAG: hypothetical protein U9Q99_00660 [Nanoarchaeota archaeon]|nr:hypothetical protein [Nanoarchaeota archaeon]
MTGGNSSEYILRGLVLPLRSGMNSDDRVKKYLEGRKTLSSK